MTTQATLVVSPPADEELSVHDAVADALERELVDFTGQTRWERSKIDAAAQRIILAAHHVEAAMPEAHRSTEG